MTYEIWSNMAYRFTTFRTEYNYSQFIDGYKDFAPMLMSYKGETDAKLTCPDDYNIFLGDIGSTQTIDRMGQRSTPYLSGM